MKFLRFALVAVAGGMLLGGCTINQEALRDFAQRARQGIAIAAQEARNVLDQVCEQQPTINLGAQTAISIAQSRAMGPGPHPKTQAAIRDINTSMAALAAACSSGNASTSSLVSLGLKAWNAYQAVMAAQAAAQAANGA
jgi:hypothetical protein